MKTSLSILLFICACALPGRAEPINIDSRRELFVDRLIVGELKDTRLKLHTPQLMLPISPPRPHGHYATVLRAKDKFQFYYRGDTKKDNHWKKGWEQYHDGEVTLYAESKDGINWVEPKLGVYPDHPTFPKGNVVLMNEFLTNHNFTPFIDTKPGVPAAEKYKALGGLAYQKHKEHLAVREKRGPGGLKAYVSPDGIHWKRLQDKPVIPEEWGKYFDSQNYAFWSDSEQAYVCYFRRFIKGYRGIARTTSKDFINWTPFVELPVNLPGEHLYTACTQPYFRAPHIYVALPTRYMSKRGSATDILFMSTRGGSTYDREFTESFIRPGIGSDGWANRANYAAIGIYQTSPSEMSIFLTQGRRYTLRLDGFASVNAPLDGGEMITKPLIFSGNELEINYSTSAAGEMRVELQDVDGKALPGFSLEDCDPIWGDHIARTVTWNEGSDLGTLTGQTIKIRFAMNDADLYSIKFNQNAKPKQANSSEKQAWLKSLDPAYGHLPAMAFVEEDPKLPRVLLIGDSISMGYTEPTRKLLDGKANVLRIPANAGHSNKGLERLEQWLGDKKWDVIHFNWGLHDGFRKLPLQQYQANLLALVKILKQTGARLIWASTTPIPKDNPWGAPLGIEIEYNAAAKTIMENQGIAIDELYAAIKPVFTQHNTKAGDVHFKASGSLLLAERVASSISEQLK